MKLRMISDPGHAWLEVPLHPMRKVGLNPTDFSRFSYRNRNVFYLEEDCDAPKFIRTWQETCPDEPLDIEEVYQEHTAIRGYASIW
jgi:hypothetical protein